MRLGCPGVGAVDCARVEAARDKANQARVLRELEDISKAAIELEMKISDRALKWAS